MTEKQQKLLDEEEYVLEAARGHGWVRPLDVGGSSGSFHSRALSRLVEKGVMERKQRGTKGRMRGSWKYRVVDDVAAEAQP